MCALSRGTDRREGRELRYGLRIRADAAHRRTRRGPGGYEAALAGAQLGAEVTLVEREGVGGSAVLTDVVPSKTLIATAEATTGVGEAADLAVLHARESGLHPSRRSP